MFRVRPPSRRRLRTWPEASCAGSLRLGLELRSPSRLPTLTTFCEQRDQRPWIDIALLIFSGPGLLDLVGSRPPS